ncbi:MAG: lipoyl domain-containing protein, partial [Bacteroidota bacterium]
MSKIELKMPKMGESITEGTIIDWMVKEGEAFEEGDILLEVATDKVDNEVPAHNAGVLVKTLFGPKDVVPVGEVIAILELNGESGQTNTDNPSKTGKTETSKNTENNTTKKRKEKPV